MSRIEKLLKAIINNTTYDEPRLSRIEEIFYSMLYSLPYNADAQSRIEALLLVLKESGLYDERTLSRIEEILKCKLDGSTYTGWIGSRVEMLLNEWELSEIIEATFTSFPIIIKANGKPLLDYIISGNTVQNVTPTPDNPIMPQGCGERTRNLLPSPAPETKSNNGITVRSDGDGRYYVSGTAENDAYITFNIPPFLIPISVGLNGNGTFSIFNTKTYQNAAVKLEFYYQGTLVDNWGLINLNRTSTNYSAMANKTTDTVGIFVKSGSTVDFQISPEFTNDGVLPANYEPYGYKISISSANITTPVYLGEVETTRKIRKLVLTGEERWNRDDATGVFSTDISNSLSTSFQSGISSHWPFEQNVGVYTQLTEGRGCIRNAFNSLWIRDNSFPSVNEFKVYLAAQYAAGTPVTVWYVLAETETTVVNEPLMKIGDYADTISMEQAGVEIPTLNKPNNTVIDVETDLKPSKMYVKYNDEGTCVYITSDNKLYITSNNEFYVLKR